MEIMVVSKEFEGKSAVNRQRMVYKVRCAAIRLPEGVRRAMRGRCSTRACYRHEDACGSISDLLAAGAALGNTPNRCHAVPALQAIWEELQDTVHAVDAMVTKTPEEAGM